MGAIASAAAAAAALGAVAGADSARGGTSGQGVETVGQGGLLMLRTLDLANNDLKEVDWCHTSS